MTNSIILVWIPIILWSFFFFFYIVVHRGRNRQILSSFPSGFTTMGVLGTFLGITIGLSDFQTDNITDSIPLLLEGLKSAFYTSIAGMVISVLSAKFMQTRSYMKAADSPETSELKNLSTAFNYNFKELTLSIDKNMTEQTSLMRSVVGRLNDINQTSIDTSNSTLSAIENNTLKLESIGEISANTKKIFDIASTQKDLLKEHVIEQHNQHNNLVQVLKNNNQELSEKIAEMNSKGLLEAMEKSVEVFQTQMEDIMQRLVKKNFEQLNKSVAQLNTWQEENKEILSHLSKELKEIITTNREITQEFAGTSKVIESKFNETAQQMQEITGHTKNLTDDNSRLAKIAKELEEITLGDNKFKAILEKSEETIESLRSGSEKFEKGMDSVSDWMNKSYRLEQSMVAVLAELKELSNLKNINGEYWKDIKSRLEEGINIITNANKNLNNGLENIDSQFKNNLNETFGNLDELIRGYIKN